MLQLAVEMHARARAIATAEPASAQRRQEEIGTVNLNVRRSL